MKKVFPSESSSVAPADLIKSTYEELAPFVIDIFNYISHLSYTHNKTPFSKPFFPIALKDFAELMDYSYDELMQPSPLINVDILSIESIFNPSKAPQAKQYRDYFEFILTVCLSKAICLNIETSTRSTLISTQLFTEFKYIDNSEDPIYQVRLGEFFFLQMNKDTYLIESLVK